MLKFTKSKLENEFIEQILERIIAKFPETDRLSMYMDLSACNAQCPLKLDKLLVADEFNFWHDVSGIRQHINRQTGLLEDCFLPRFAY